VGLRISEMYLSYFNPFYIISINMAHFLYGGLTTAQAASKIRHLCQRSHEDVRNHRARSATIRDI
jgi:hypothetical protein